MAYKFDAENPAILKKLCAAVEYSKRQKKPFEEFRLELRRRIVGKFYGENGSFENRPINRLQFNENVFLRGLVPHFLQAHVTTNYRELTAQAADLELAINQQLKRIKISDAFAICAMEAMTSLGVMEVGITSKNTPPDGEGNLYDPGQLFADPVLFEDLILDMAAKHWDQQSFMGHDFIVPFEWVKENPSFDPEVRGKLTAPERDWSLDDTRSEELSWSGGEVEEFEDTIRLRQLFLPRQQLVLLFVVGTDKANHYDPLQIIEWEGPERGPYHPLSFGRVPGNLIPLAPAISWFELDDIVNKTFNKAADQALAQKDVVFASPANIADAEAARDADNLDIISVQDPKSIVPASFGGANEKNLGMAMWAGNMSNLLAGNPEAIAGTGPQSGTVGQDQLITENASGKLKEMQATALEFQSGVLQDLAYWLYTDPISEYHLVKEVGNSGYTLNTTWGPENRVGDFFDYNVQASPYVYPQRSPGEKSNRLIEILMNVVVPLAPLQGQGLNVEDIFKTIAKYENLPELARWYQPIDGEQIPPRQPVGSKPAQTTRRYVRENRPGATRQGQDQVMQRMLLGGEASQPAEMAALMRPAG